MWDTTTLTQLYKLPPATADVQLISFSSSKHLIAVASEWRSLLDSGQGVQLGGVGNYERRQGGITLWDSRTGVPVKSLSNLPGFITSIDFSPDGSRFAASFGYQLYDTWENQPDGGIKAGNLLGTFGETRIWDLQSTTLPFTFKSIRGLAGAKEPHWTDPVTQANFNQDGTILVTVNQYHGNVEVCDADSLTRLGSLTVSSADDSSVYAAIPMSGSQVALILHNNKSSDASLNDTFTLEVWDWKSGRRLQVITTEAFDTLVYDTTDQSIEGVGLNGTLTKWICQMASR